MVPIFEKVFERVITLDPEKPFKIREVNSGLPGGGSDHQSYLGAGVPGLFWDQVSKEPNFYGRTHHTQHDTYEAALPDHQRHTAMVVAIGAWGIANLDALLPREGIVGRGGRRGSPRMLGVNTDEDGVTLSEIIEGSAADRAGLKVGDKILKIGDREVKDNQSLRDAIRDAAQKTTVRFKRGDKELEIPVAFDRMLGIATEENSLVVNDVTDGGPAAKAKVKTGDKIVKYDGKDVKDLDGLREALRQGSKKAKLTVLRDGKELELEVEFER
jgi:membrane-associated protease RseP (regulator of RpoE activity)